MPSLAFALADLAPLEGGFAIAAPEDWAQGRTLYGGLTAALLREAAVREHGDAVPLRSAQLAFAAPVTGMLRLSTAVLRQRRSATVIGAEARTEEGLAARATFFHGLRRESVVVHDRMPMPDVPPPDDCSPFHRTTKPLTGFLANFDMRLAAGARLFEPDKPPEFAVWTRYREPHGTDPVTALLALADALPCAAMASFPRLAPVSTMSWQIDLAPGAGAAEGDWHLVTSASEQAAEGYSLQAMRVYSARGRLLAIARQVVAIFA